MELFAVGDMLLVRDAGRATLRLIGSGGVVAQWSMLPTPDGGSDATSVEWVDDFCVLEDPPRIALIMGSGALIDGRSLSTGTNSVVIVDPLTGSVQARAQVTATRALGFAPSGDRVFVELRVGWSETQIASYDAGMQLLQSIDFAGVMRTFIGDDGARLLLQHESWQRQGTLAFVDLLTAQQSSFGPSLTGAVIADAAVTRCAASQFRRTAHVVVISDVATGAEEHVALSQGEPHARLFADRSLARVVAFDETGRIRSCMRDGDDPTTTTIADLFGAGEWRTIGLDVDVERRRFLVHHRGHAHVRGLEGTELASHAATAALIVATGDVAVLHNGEIVTLSIDSDRRAAVVPGPARVRAFARHRRGVIALDDDDRAHVVEL